MATMSEPQHHKCIIADFIDGNFHFKTTKGEHLVVELGPAQVISAKRGMDRYVAGYDVQEAKG